MKISRTLLFMLAGAVAPAWAAALTPAEIAESATPSVVLIKVPNGLGSGFVVSTDGRIVTNIHVIRGAGTATVVAADGREFTDIELLGTDEEHDVAVLRIGAHGLKALPLGDSSAAKPGQHIVAIGHPLGLGNTVSDGLVSAVREFSATQHMLQISAPISPGSSGGPVFNDRGEVIGISTLVVSGGQNLNFAVPINIVKPLLTQDKGIPLADYKAQPERGRAIPKHSLALLDGCPAPEFERLIGSINRAINIGAPLYNKGNIEACYRIYASAALDVQNKIESCPGPKQALLDGIKRADTLEGWSPKAWAMRDAFDGVLAVVELQNGAAAEPKSGRPIPHLPPTALQDCDAQAIQAVSSDINDAIASGAPLYNEGNIEACYWIYEGVISEIDRKVQGCAVAKATLQDGLHQAGQSEDWKVKSWALRDAFDGVIEAVQRQKSAEK